MQNHCDRKFDLDGNGWIDLNETTMIVKSVYASMSPKLRAVQNETAEKKAKDIFNKMKKTGDKRVSRGQFARSLNNPEILNLIKSITRYHLLYLHINLPIFTLITLIYNIFPNKLSGHF